MAQTGDLSRFTAFVRPEAQTREELESKVKNYEKLYDDKEGGIEKRKESYTSMVNSFYDLVTNFYEWGWGHSFHFAPRNHWETWEASIARHEMYLAHRLELTQGKVALDVGCGIGGPGRTMARFSESTVVGLNNNAYQLERARHHTRTQRLEGQCKYLKGDFMHIPEKDNTFDAAFAIEATCHAPDKVGVYSEIARVLKPGGLFGTY
jgi:sterol 24-C-methyltransferase